MLSKKIKITCFGTKKKNNKIKRFFYEILQKKNPDYRIIDTFSNNYQYSYNKKEITKFKKYKSISIFGLGGSSLCIKAIYNFLKFKIRKKVYFYDNLNVAVPKIVKNKNLDIVISKSGSTLETIVNQNIFSNSKRIFITENKKSYLTDLALKLKSEIIEHRNFVGGRYSVLSEVGMLPAELLGLKSEKFKKFDYLIKNKNFISTLINNVDMIYKFYLSGKTNSVILNFDRSSIGLLEWYQQLLSESLGKKGKGFFPIISNLPKDNHSLMQLYLDGNKNNFFTIFDNIDYKSPKIKNENLLPGLNFLKNKSIKSVMIAQKNAVKKVFKNQGIKFRNFEILKKDEESLGIIFTYFMLETILLGKLMKLNPFDQPAVESIKKETKKILS
ncbi:glucose-6-phosphate isomerase [Candidatus Pelagibacter sp.]|nr:glucose-6-phosphate isomerase [Candidatus Pelagibacter sp.]